MPIVKAEQYSSVRVDAIIILRKATLVHMNIMDTRSERGSKNISSCGVADSIIKYRPHHVQYIIFTTWNIVGQDLSGINIEKVLHAIKVETLQFGISWIIVAVAEMTVVLVIVTIILDEVKP